MNSFNTTWSLCLNKPYLNGGYENSSRVFNKSGWDDPGLRSGVHVEGAINDPSKGSKYWTVEIAFPIVNMVYNTSASVSRGRGLLKSSGNILGPRSITAPAAQRLLLGHQLLPRRVRGDRRQQHLRQGEVGGGTLGFDGCKPPLPKRLRGIRGTGCWRRRT